MYRIVKNIGQTMKKCEMVRKWCENGEKMVKFHLTCYEKQNIIEWKIKLTG